MTEQDFQDKLNAIVQDLQTNGKGMTTQYRYRTDDGNLTVLPLSSDANGSINAAQYAAVSNMINSFADEAENYNTNYAPVKATSEAYNTARSAHQTLIDTAAASRAALTAALDADANCQAAKTAVDTARSSPAYRNALLGYRSQNISENYNNLIDAKGKYAM